MTKANQIIYVGLFTLEIQNDIKSELDYKLSAAEPKKTRAVASAQRSEQSGSASCERSGAYQLRRDRIVVECASLETMQSRKALEGSNPSLSARKYQKEHIDNNCERYY